MKCFKCSYSQKHHLLKMSKVLKCLSSSSVWQIWELLWNFLNFLWIRNLCFEPRWLPRMVFIIFNTLATFRIYLTSFISTLNLKNPSLSGCKMWLQPSETSSGTSKQPLGQGMLGALWMSLVSLTLNITSCIVFCMHGFFSHVGNNQV